MEKKTIRNTIEKISNRFDLILVAAKRARQIQIEKKEVLVNNNKDKCTIIALKEIEKKLTFK